jgi:hypothetical protein
MSAYEDQLRRDAAAISDAIQRTMEGVIEPVLRHTARVHDMASELSQVSDRASHDVERLRKSPELALAELAVTADILRDLSDELHQMTRQSVADVERLKADLVQTLRAQAIANRRRSRRFETDLAVEVDIEGSTRETRILNLSLGGARIDAAVNTRAGTPVTLRLPGLANDLSGEVVRVTEDGTQLRFTLADAVADELQGLLKHIDADPADPKSTAKLTAVEAD